MSWTWHLAAPLATYHILPWNQEIPWLIIKDMENMKASTSATQAWQRKIFMISGRFHLWLTRKIPHKTRPAWKCFWKPENPVLYHHMSCENAISSHFSIFFRQTQEYWLIDPHQISGFAANGGSTRLLQSSPWRCQQTWGPGRVKAVQRKLLGLIIKHRCWICWTIIMPVISSDVVQSYFYDFQMWQFVESMDIQGGAPQL